MADSTLRQIEKEQGLNFSTREIRDLLGKPKAEKFINDHLDLLESLNLYGLENVSELDEEQRKDFIERAGGLLKIDLKKRLDQIEELLYLKKIEETLSKKVESRIVTQQEDFRKEMRRLIANAPVRGFEIRMNDEERIDNIVNEIFRKEIGKILKEEHTPLDMFSLKELRATKNIEKFEGLRIPVDEEYVKEYRKLVQYEVREQLKQVGEIKLNTKQKNQEEQFRELYQQADELITFIVSHIEEREGEKSYLKAYLHHKVRSVDGKRYIEKFYTKLQEALVNPSECKQIIQQMVTHQKTFALFDKADQINDMISKYSTEKNLTSKEQDHFLSTKYYIGNDGLSYHQKLAQHLEEIEYCEYNMALEMMLGEKNSERMSEYETRLENEKKLLNEDLRKFREEYYSVNRIVDLHFADQGEITKNKLKTASNAIAGIRGDKPELGGKDSGEYRAVMKDIIKRLKNITTEGDINSYLAECEKEVEEALIAQGISEATLKRNRDNDSLFDIYSFYAESQRSKDQEKMAEKSEEEKEPLEERDENKTDDTQPFLTDETVLTKLRDLMKQMEKISNDNFSKGKNDREEFDKLNKWITDEMGRHKYWSEEALFDHEGKPLMDVEWKNQITQKKKKTKMLPFEERERLHSLLLQRARINQYEKLHDLKLIGVNQENPENLKEGMKALMGGHFEHAISSPQLDKLVKVMTLKHPLTSIRFQYGGKRDPFMYRGKYEIHRVPGKESGEPATFAERAKYLLGKARDAMSSGNYAALDRMFQVGNEGWKLYADASFFPVNKLKDENVTQKILFQEKEKIRRNQDKQYFADCFDETNLDRCIPKKELEEEVAELNSISGALFDEEEYRNVFGAGNREQIEEMAETYDALRRYDETGMISDSLTKGLSTEELNALIASKEGVTKGLGGSDESYETLDLALSKRLPRGKIQKMIEEYPIIASRMMQMNSMNLGAVVGGAEMAARWGVNVAKAGVVGGADVTKMYWKGLQFYTPISIWHAIDQMVEHIEGLADFRTKTAAYDLLKKVFAGTLVGNEFAKLYQSQQDKRVDEFKSAFKQFGINEVLDKLYTAADPFELKAALIEGFENRGIITNENLLDRRFIRNINRYTTTVIVPTEYDEKTMNDDRDIKDKMLDKMRAAIDEIWGQGTWQSWRSSGTSKYESLKKEASENFRGKDPKEKAETHNKYWEMLRTKEGIAKLREMHPAEIVGNIEQDLIQGDNDSGMTFTIMQAMISMGIVKLDHLRRLQTDHTNDLPIHALLEPDQAKISGLTEHVINALKKYKKIERGNPIHDFYQGEKVLQLNAVRSDGKWSFPRTEDNKSEKVNMTAHQLQRTREAQPEGYRKMDNSCMGLFLPCSKWSAIQGAFKVDTNGKIPDARPHDFTAGYRGMHNEFASYMESMSKEESYDGMDDKTKKRAFLRDVWMAYLAITKTQAFASFMTQHRQRDNDYTLNEFDASPNFSEKITDKRVTGDTNFKELMISIDGSQQRMKESSRKLDSLDGMSNELRREFKMMAGFQHSSILGVNPETGKEDKGGYVPYNTNTFDPSNRWKTVIKAFVENVKVLAIKQGLGNVVAKSIEDSQMANFSMDNNLRQTSLHSWVTDKNEAGL